MLSFLKRRRQSNDSDISGFNTEETRVKSRKPPNTAFRQQRLKSWQPILSPKSVLPLLLLLAVIFTPLGIALIFTTFNVQQVIIEYGKCSELANTDNFTEIPSKLYTTHFHTNTNENPSWKLVEGDADSDLTCQVQFQVPNDIKGPIFLYYRLTNFFQNHREYVESYDSNQIKGEAVAANDLDSDCNPLNKNSEGKAYYPCGLIANSYFNDTFSSLYTANDSSIIYEMTDSGISWKSDRSRYKKTTYDPSDIVPPPNWAKRFPDGYTSENLPNLSEWESLQVWMRTAALPSFMKLALKNETATLTEGVYIVDIGLNYPVSIFGGTKSLVLSTSTVLGGRNLSLGIAYLVVAGLAVLLGLVFLGKYFIKPRKLGDHGYLNFERDDNEQATRTVREIL